MKTSISFRMISASSLGTILEWYDFSLFAYLTPILSKLFFPPENQLTALILTYAIFAIGFFVRPFGAILFGHLGDRVGRKKTLAWSILLMSLSTFFIGLLPTYSTAGIAASIILIILRICQGLSAGGESTGASLFVLESIPLKRRGFMGAFLWSMTGIGMLLGSFSAALVAHCANCTWAWRVPFLLGMATGLIAYFLRRHTPETLQFSQIIQCSLIEKFPLGVGLVKYKNELLIIMGLYSLSAMITYLIFIFMPSYAANILGMPLATTTSIGTFSFLCSTFLVPLGGYLSDEIGRKSCLRWSALGFIFLSYPLFQIISQGSIEKFFLVQFIFVILAACFQGALTITVLEMFPPSVRYSLAAVGYNVSYSLFGGTAPLIATFFVNMTGDKSAPGWVLVLGALLALVAVNKIQIDNYAKLSLQRDQG